MAIEGIAPVQREMPTANMVSQLSLTRGEEKLQEEDAQPPMEVAAAEEPAVHWRKEEELPEKWRRRALRKRRKQCLADEQEAETEAAEAMQAGERTEIPTEGDETGMRFDIRS